VVSIVWLYSDEDDAFSMKQIKVFLSSRKTAAMLSVLGSYDSWTRSQCGKPHWISFFILMCLDTVFLLLPMLDTVMPMLCHDCIVCSHSLSLHSVDLCDLTRD